MVATDQAVNAGTAPSASATADVSSGQAGGFTLALVSTEESSGDDVSETDTSLSVATTLGPLWTTDTDEMPFDINVGGEQMTVTAISGSSSPQTFTVTRSVNGVTKEHASGSDVRLWTPKYREL
jgi:hypothetical protein